MGTMALTLPLVFSMRLTQLSRAIRWGKLADADQPPCRDAERSQGSVMGCLPACSGWTNCARARREKQARRELARAGRTACRTCRPVVLQNGEAWGNARSLRGGPRVASLRTRGASGHVGIETWACDGRKAERSRRRHLLGDDLHGPAGGARGLLARGHQRRAATRSRSSSAQPVCGRHAAAAAGVAGMVPR